KETPRYLREAPRGPCRRSRMTAQPPPASRAHLQQDRRVGLSDDHAPRLSRQVPKDLTTTPKLPFWCCVGVMRKGEVLWYRPDGTSFPKRSVRRCEFH